MVYFSIAKTTSMKKMILPTMKKSFQFFHVTWIQITVIFLLMQMPFMVFAQQKTVSGRITNETGQAIQGASVIVKGSSKGVSTDAAGKFNIAVDESAVLIISSVGYTVQLITVKEQNSFDIKLLAKNKNLDEVIVVGYGSQRKKDITGAVVSVTDKELREVPVANLQQGLQGRAAGLEIQRSGTTPGSGGQIRIRGIHSIFGSNDPLFVVDGIPFDGSLNDINPDDVASIEILKDASATAIYGSRGGNGVILVTTKKGKTGETKISYNGYYGIGQVADKYPVFNAQEYQAMRNISTWGAGYQPEEKNGIALGRSTDWQDLMYGPSLRTDHNISVYGGSNGNNFSLGGGYFKETSVLPAQDFTRYSVRAAIDSRVGKKIKVGITSLNQVSVTNGSQFVAGSVMFPTIALSPLMPAYNADGSLVYLPNGNIDDNNSQQYTPLLLKRNNNNWVDKVRRLSTFNTLYGEYAISKSLKYRINVGLTFRQQENNQFQGRGDTAKIPTNPNFFRGLKGNTAIVNNSSAWGYTVENILTYDKTIATKHHINLTGLYSVQEDHTHNTQIQKDSIAEDFVQFYNMALSNPTPAAVVSGGESSWALISYMGRLNYGFDDRFLLTLTGRLDGSSRLAEGNKWHEYAAAAVGWNLINESFLKNSRTISNLRLRASYGQTSNQSIDPYASLGLVSNANNLTSPGNVIRYNYGPTIVTGYNVITLPNKI